MLLCLAAVRYFEKIKIMKDTWDAYLPPFVSIWLSNEMIVAWSVTKWHFEKINKKIRTGEKIPALKKKNESFFLLQTK